MNAKEFVFGSYNRFITLLWIVLCILWLLMFVAIAPLFESFIFIVVTFTPIILLTSFLTNYLLPRAIRKRKMRIFVWQFIIHSIIMGLIFACAYHFFYWMQDGGYMAQTHLLDPRRPFFIDFVHSISSSLMINLCFFGLRFYFEHTKLQEVHLSTQLQNLQNQINPHFMFNVLNHIHILMQKNVDLASELLIKYSDILRYQLYKGKQETVTLETELCFMKDFVEVEKMRWGKEVTVNCSWMQDNGDVELAPLLLITLIENGFKHVSRGTAEKGYIHIDFAQKGNNIFLKVENSKINKANPVQDSGLGLDNLKKRLDILYPERYSLSIIESDLVYSTKLSLHI